MSTRTHISEKPAPATIATPSPARFGTLQRKCACGGASGSSGSSSSSGECSECKNKKLQRRPAVGVQPGIAPPIVHDVLRSPGNPLDTATRAYMEPRFGHDFSKVRVHADAQAATSARSVNALAYTVGNDLVFNSGQYSPSTRAGRRLMAHELAHVVQQSGSGSAPAGVTPMGAPGDRFERNADQAASSIESRTQSSRQWSALPDRLPTLRRAVTIPPDSATFATTDVPTNNVVVSPTLVFAITSDPISFVGTAKAECGQGESASGYELGIVQVETSETNNQYYAGETSADGSIHVIRDQPPIRPAGTCTDSESGKFWISSAPLVCGNDATVKRSDTPGRLKFPTTMQNARTNKTNYLQSLNIKFEFTTGLIAKRPDGSLQALRWIGWSETWEDSFNRQPNGEVQAAGRGLHQTFVRASQSGSPPPELPTQYAVPTRTCNDLSIDAENNPRSIVAYGGS